LARFFKNLFKIQVDNRDCEKALKHSRNRPCLMAGGYSETVPYFIARHFARQYQYRRVIAQFQSTASDCLKA